MKALLVGIAYAMAIVFTSQAVAADLPDCPKRALRLRRSPSQLVAAAILSDEATPAAWRCSLRSDAPDPC